MMDCLAGHLAVSAGCPVISVNLTAEMEGSTAEEEAERPAEEEAERPAEEEAESYEEDAAESSAEEEQILAESERQGAILRRRW